MFLRCLIPNVIFRIKITPQELPTVKKNSFGLQFICIKYNIKNLNQNYKTL